MAEGVDLHLHCRHVFHHDLDWNPSVLEQRMGRLDDLGSKAAKTKLPIIVDEPFIEATQDEKQFRVVKDRLRWFNAVMRNQRTSVPFSPHWISHPFPPLQSEPYVHPGRGHHGFLTRQLRRGHWWGRDRRVLRMARKSFCSVFCLG